MEGSNGDEGNAFKGGSGCLGCGARLAPDQRYCLECGERQGPLPPAVTDWLSIVPPEPVEVTVAAGADDALDAESAMAAEDEDPLRRYMPEPRTAAVAVMALLAFGVLLGGMTGPVAQSAGIAPIVLYTEAAPAPISPEPEEEAPEPVEPVPVASTAPEEAPLPAAPPPAESPATPKPPAKEPPPEPLEEETLPPVTHVFLIVLGDSGYEGAYGESSPAPYLAQTLREKGELLANYYAVTKGDLANEIALLSGQGPTAATAANCPEYTDIPPGTLDAKGLVEGQGCVFPAGAQTLPSQLMAAKKTWKAYVEDIGNGQAGQATSCRHPAPGGPDDAALPRPGDAYETWRNPFVYFHALLDAPECGERDVGLDQLAADLGKEARTPSLSYIVPNACHDGGPEPCEPGQPGGLAAAQPFLETVVPEIEASAAYKKGGLIAITFAQAPQTEAGGDVSGCCTTAEYPNLPADPAATAAPPATGPVKPTGGGGKVGLLLISPFVEPGSVNESGYYNHFSLLLSVEELFGLQPLGYAAEPSLSAFDSSVFNGS